MVRHDENYVEYKCRSECWKKIYEKNRRRLIRLFVKWLQELWWFCMCVCVHACVYVCVYMPGPIIEIKSEGTTIAPERCQRYIIKIWTVYFYLIFFRWRQLFFFSSFNRCKQNKSKMPSFSVSHREKRVFVCV